MKDQVMIVDDSSTLRASVEFTLTSADYEVVSAVDGKDGLQKLEGVENPR